MNDYDVLPFLKTRRKVSLLGRSGHAM